MVVRGEWKALEQGWVVEALQGPNRVEGRVNELFKLGAGHLSALEVVTDGGSVVPINVNHWDVRVVSVGEPTPTDGVVIRVEVEPYNRHFLAWGSGAGDWDVIGPRGEFEKGVPAGELRAHAFRLGYAVETIRFVEFTAAAPTDG